jgi:serine/threonine-protein kinase HipA
MNRCPITYKECGKNLFSEKGLKLLSANLEKLNPLPFIQEELKLEAFSRAGDFALPGSSLKLLAKINTSTNSFEFSSLKGKFILKPQNILYPGVPENEDLTMKMAEVCGIEVPFHGLIYNSDKSLTYFVKRFDRGPGKIKYRTEDFSQLSGKYKAEKYDSSMEEVAEIADGFCTFPVIEKIKLFRITVFNYLIGNGNAHLKKFSIIKRDDVVMFSPFYNLLNTAILNNNLPNEIALSLNNKKTGFNKYDFFDYYGVNVLKINLKSLLNVLNVFESSISKWLNLIQISFLSEKNKQKYLKVLEERIIKFFK